MKTRGFLKRLGAAIIAPFLPVPAEALGMTAREKVKLLLLRASNNPSWASLLYVPRWYHQSEHSGVQKWDELRLVVSRTFVRLWSNQGQWSTHQHFESKEDNSMESGVDNMMRFVELLPGFVSWESVYNANFSLEAVEKQTSNPFIIPLHTYANQATV